MCLVQVVSLDIEGPQGRYSGDQSKLEGVSRTPVKNCLDGDGYLAPGRTATRALNRKHTQTNTDTHKCSTDRARSRPQTQRRWGAQRAGNEMFSLMMRDICNAF